ncbi:hypothetical protein BKP37_05280 [Anaerobacillus alkalilacustris]|uniref:CBS domain-containing protein n=1 Tax=Anaerobacillus alkalilacustris TaxID=393763 RepID=A0A1S2LY77_9BACI|nr:CBS domain-containing protein [Anaerobacillus alkalilacustris]OIJ16647.1 hypothetical protein BKP37_05280 [Anaerobacillus alkalilacustris]
MQVIISHVNLDFDGLASMLAAKKLYPQAKMVLPTKQGKSVERFLALYRDSINYYSPNQINWENVSEVIMVDTASLKRIGELNNYIKGEKVNFIVYDHHQPTEHNVLAKETTIEEVGATITLLLEKIKMKNITISAFEATIFALGLYTDTGSFSYLTTTSRDLKVGSYLLEHGANLHIISKYTNSPLNEHDQKLFHSLIQNSEEHYYEGVTILIAYHQQNEYTGGLSILANKAIEITGTDALIFVVEMGKRIFIVGRSSSDRVNILPIIKHFSGNGHQKASSAMVKNYKIDHVLDIIRKRIRETVQPAIMAKDIMSSPVKFISSATTIEKAAKMVIRYGHTGFPVVDENKLVGVISRRDIDKAKHHGLGHAPVKGYMSTRPITVHSSTVVEEIQKIMINKNIGRLPVLENNELIGIVTRTNVIEFLYGNKNRDYKNNAPKIKVSLIEKINSLLPRDIIDLLIKIANLADKTNYPVFLVGGIVRDLILGRRNEDVDVVVEGDGPAFASKLAKEVGGDIRVHEKFGTATWRLHSGLKIDITSARTEYYDFPAALPTVHLSGLREDLYRRDFTINAMAIQLNKDKFGDLIDLFHGYQDISQKKIRTLYNLSFVEDPTRILRAVRFEQRFGFEMDEQTFDLAQISVDKIRLTSKPRLAYELSRLLSEKHPVESLKRLDEIGVLNFLITVNSYDNSMIKQIKNFKLIFDNVSSQLTNPPTNVSQAWICYLVLLFSKLDNGFEQVNMFTLNNENKKTIEEIKALLEGKYHFSKNNTSGSLHHTLKNYRIESILCFTILKQFPNKIAENITRYLIERQAIPKLINGNDLKALNINPGPIYSKILQQIECDYLDKKVSSKEEAILMIKENY